MNTIFKMILIMASITGLFACTSRGQMSQIAMDDPKQAATVYVFREDNISSYLANFKVTFNDKDVYGIGSGEYVKFNIPEGRQSVGLKCIGDMFLPIPSHKKIEFTSKAHSNYYFLITTADIRYGDHTCARIKQISDIEAAKWFQIVEEQK